MGSVQAAAQTVAYEGNDWPENVGWIRASFCNPPRTLIDDWLQQRVGPCPGDPLPGGQQESFRRGLGEFVGYASVFLEWRMVTDGPSSEIIGVAPASIVMAGNFGTNYHFTIARDQVRMIRDNLLPILYEPLSPDLPHTIRLELRTDASYALYVDSRVVEEGVPEGPFPQNDSAVISFRAKCWYEPSNTSWDYVRFGVIPDDASGDFDNEDDVDLRDFYFFHECLTNDRIGISGGPNADAGTGCRWADFDGDDDVDLADVAAFQISFTGPP